MENEMKWQPIETAPKDGQVILVNDNSEFPGTKWSAAKWLESPEWSGWIYDDELLQDSTPLGPRPSFWLDVPPLPV